MKRYAAEMARGPKTEKELALSYAMENHGKWLDSYHAWFGRLALAVWKRDSRRQKGYDDLRNERFSTFVDDLKGTYNSQKRLGIQNKEDERESSEGEQEKKEKDWLKKDSSRLSTRRWHRRLAAGQVARDYLSMEGGFCTFFQSTSFPKRKTVRGEWVAKEWGSQFLAPHP